MAAPQVSSEPLLKITPGADGAAFLFGMSVAAPSLIGGFAIGLLGLNRARFLGQIRCLSRSVRRERCAGLFRGSVAESFDEPLVVVGLHPRGKCNA
jgi:hypothetical protein